MIIDADYAEVGAVIVTIRMSKQQAEWAQSGLSDIACWARGFNAALGADDRDRSPMGIEAVREINIALKKALEASE